jgi:hypothetical protein
MINISVFKWIVSIIFLSSFGVVAYSKIGHTDIGKLDFPQLLEFFWAPVSTGVTAVGVFYGVLRAWLWRLPIMRGWLVLLPDLTGTWLAKSRGEAFGGVPHYSKVTIKHDFDRLTYRAWRCQSTVISEVCVLERVDQEVRLFIVYGNRVGTIRDQHGLNHDGCLFLVLSNEDKPKLWKLQGEYWTNKARKPETPLDRGTVGTIEMSWQGRARLADDDDIVKNHFAGERAAIEAFND